MTLLYKFLNSVFCSPFTAVVVGFTREEYNITEGAEQSVCVSILEGEIQSGGPPIALTVSALDGTAQGMHEAMQFSYTLNISYPLPISLS